MDEELEAMKSKGVITLISKREMPEDTKAIKTMWVYSVKTDHLGNVIRLRARIVARGDKQRPGIDYGETFSPVARMATFRMFVATCLLMDLTIYQGDINTAYLNAPLGIKQYLDSLDGYPSETDDMVYVVHKALYGLKQSGREWNTEYVKKAVELWKVKTDVNPSDLMTKPLASARFEALITMIGMTKNVLPQ
ncbi:unnamed protein product [Hyaloperonospora brassicae]|uniref:Reverse transcriptase Ty1/copia-type domain-containing protein n=1 Tax=Hyaloperonospora brassicae TaxID=162125 RepID=A0AAV0TD09_HYABA|nr:unnamed protein product [Hyaloperonospora brassicae]